MTRSLDQELKPLSGSTLLHNMSARPQTQIEHVAPAGRAYGRGVIYSLPKNVKKRSARQLLTWLDGKPCRKTVAEAEVELRRRINEHAQTLPLPAAAAVSDSCRENDKECLDPLSTVTVLAKSSSRVYLRNKEPNLSAIRSGRRVVVIVPEPSSTRSSS